MKKDKYNAQQARLHKERYYRLKKEAQKKLGGKCIKCGSLEKLEFDHINPSSKLGDVTRLLGLSLKLFWAEVKKCQLLCRLCHVEKTIKENGFQRIIDSKGLVIKHGTLSSYRYCKCEICRQVKNKWHGEWKLKNGITVNLRQPLQHGSVVMYGYHKCRCDICKRGHNQKQKLFYQKRKQASIVQ